MQRQNGKIGNSLNRGGPLVKPNALSSVHEPLTVCKKCCNHTHGSWAAWFGERYAWYWSFGVAYLDLSWYLYLYQYPLQAGVSTGNLACSCCN